MDPRGVARIEWAVAIALAIVAFVAFSPGLFGPFLWDDTPLILGNAQVRSLGAFRTWFTKDFWDVTQEAVQSTPRLHYFRPLVTGSYALELHFAGPQPFLFHLDNLVAHAAASVLAFFTLRRWAGAILPAAFAAAFFALHPTKAESVAWIAGRTDVLCAVFVLLASTGAALRLRGRRRSGIALEVVATVLAYCTKEGAVVLPAFVALEAWAAETGETGTPPVVDKATVLRLLRAAAPQLAVAIAYLVARAVWMPVRPQAPKVLPADHLQFVLESVGRYVGLALAPHDLSGQHALLRTVAGRAYHATGWVAFGAVSIVTLAAIAFAARARAPRLTLGIVLFGGALLPVSNVMMTGISTLVAERFLYLPIVGLALALTVPFEWLLAHTRKAAVVGCAAVLVLVSVALALERSIDFSDEARFWDHERALHPESLEALRFSIRRAREQRQYRQAEKLAIEARATAGKWYSHSGVEAEFVLLFVELRALVTPDRTTSELSAIDGFYQALLDPHAKVAELKIPNLSLSMPLVGSLGEHARLLRTRILTARAELLSRLGMDPAARAQVTEALSSCGSCERPRTVAVLVFARAGDYPAARANLAALGEKESEALRRSIDKAELARKQASMASGPLALQLSATELATLEAWGRAYTVLEPYRTQIELAPGFAVGFAELAFRAGDEQVAREVLKKHVPEEKIGPLLEEWAVKMGWR